MVFQVFSVRVKSKLQLQNNTEIKRNRTRMGGKIYAQCTAVKGNDNKRSRQPFY
jgi:hypothetical protein